MSYALPLSMNEPDDRETRISDADALEYLADSVKHAVRIDALIMAIRQRDVTWEQVKDRVDNLFDSAIDALEDKRRDER